MFSWIGRKVAVTGATGFVGSHAALELRRHGAEVRALVRSTSNVQRLRYAGITCKVASLEDTSGLTHALEGCEFVVHVAGAVGFDRVWDNYFRVNVQGTRNLLEAARQTRVSRFVHTSSIVAVGASTTTTSLNESARWNLGSRRVPYVTTKRWAEEAALAANGGGIEVVVVNPASVIGPNDYSGSEFGMLCRRFWKGRIPIYFGGGNNFVDVRDVAQGIRLAAEHGRAGERYLLAGENRTYHAFFCDLCRAARRTIPRLRLPNALATLIGYVNDVRRRSTKRPSLSSAQAALMGLYFYFDAHKAQQELGYHARPLMESLADAHAFWMTPAARALSA